MRTRPAILFHSLWIALSLALSITTLGMAASVSQSSFDAFLADVWPLAQQAGVSRETYNRAIAGLTPEPSILAHPTRQGEFSLSIQKYLTQTVSAGRAAEARRRADRLEETLASMEQRYGTPKEILLALWAMESNFGGDQGATDVLRALATLALTQDRTNFFRNEFVAGLTILQRGARERLTGSWAGAMGQPQFMPSSYLKYAVSASGGEMPDIWRSDSDSLASIANFMAQSGWTPHLPAVVEVRAPPEFDWKPIDLDFAQWRELGFTRHDGQSLPESGAASLYCPAGARGPIFLITDNFEAIRQYNTSDAYALAVAALAARIRGETLPAREWPANATPSQAEVKKAQRLLAAQDYYSGDADGRLGRKTRAAVHKFQLAAHIHPADGYLSQETLAQLHEN